MTPNAKTFDRHYVPREHGTENGHAAHRRHGEAPCGACRSAHAEYVRRWRAGLIPPVSRRRVTYEEVA